MLLERRGGGLECNSFGDAILLVRAGGEDVQCRFCGDRHGDGHLFWDGTFPSSSCAEFMSLIARDRSN